MEVVCLDLEGVLIPEIWIGVAEKTGIETLRDTTRDIPDYDELMQQRLRIMAENGLGLPIIQEVIAGLDPLDGALEVQAAEVLVFTHQLPESGWERGASEHQR